MPKDKIDADSQLSQVLPGVDKEQLIQQVQNEYDLAWKHQNSKKQENLTRLKLYNNQKRDKQAAGDTTMFTIFQTVFSSLYSDRLMSDWQGTEEGDRDVADNLNAISKKDYDDMGKERLDYDWIWDTCFFGRGLLLVEEYKRDPEKKIFLPLPEVLDASTFLRDPVARSVNGDYESGKGAMRFGGSEIAMTMYDMKKAKSMFQDTVWANLKTGASTYSLFQDAQTARNEAQGNDDVTKDQEKNLGVNANYTITQWFTRVKMGDKVQKVKLWLANERSIIIGARVLKRDYWPISDRALYPHSHDWDGTSIPDLTEDKQRLRAMAQNLGIKTMRADLYPMYVYNSNKVTNKTDLSFDFNKFIGIDLKPGESVSNQILPLVKSYPNLNLLQFIYQSLDDSAQKATATPDIKIGMQPKQDRTLGETNLVSANTETRYSLAAKVFGWSERDFWKRHWYNLYRDNFEDGIDEKVLRVVGAFGAKWRTLDKKDIICNSDPDVYIESTVVSRAKNIEEFNQLMAYFQIALAEPTANRRWGLKKLGRLAGLEKDEIDRLYPPTVDERMAEKENQMLNKDELTPVKPEDDHNVHLEVHASAKDTNAAKAHIRTHEEALLIKKTRPELFPVDQSQTEMNPEDPANRMAQVGGGQVKPVASSSAS